MQDFNLDGVSSISGGVFRNLAIDGVGKCTGNIKAESVKIDGTFHCSGAVETGLFRCDGVAEFKADIRAKLCLKTLSQPIQQPGGAQHKTVL